MSFMTSPAASTGIIGFNEPTTMSEMADNIRTHPVDLIQIDSTLQISELPPRSFHEHSVCTLLSPIATPKNPTPKLRLRTEHKPAGMPPILSMHQNPPSPLERVKLTQPNKSSMLPTVPPIEHKRENYSLDYLLCAGMLVGSESVNMEMTRVSSAFITPSETSIDWSTLTTVSEWFPNPQQNSPVNIRVSSIPSSALKRKMSGARYALKLKMPRDRTKLKMPRDRTKKIPEIQEKMAEKARTCSCKHSSCLKLYCDCFAGQELCDQTCSCVACANIDEKKLERYEAIQTALSRNKSVFDNHKTTRTERRAKMLVEKSATQCHCRRSRCLKKYCQCFFTNALCNEACSCTDCRNQEM